jgi:hypothetical protein
VTVRPAWPAFGWNQPKVRARCFHRGNRRALDGRPLDRSSGPCTIRRRRRPQWTVGSSCSIKYVRKSKVSRSGANARPLALDSRTRCRCGRCPPEPTKFADATVLWWGLARCSPEYRFVPPGLVVDRIVHSAPCRPAQ